MRAHALSDNGWHRRARLETLLGFTREGIRQSVMHLGNFIAGYLASAFWSATAWSGAFQEEILQSFLVSSSPHGTLRGPLVSVPVVSLLHGPRDS